MRYLWSALVLATAISAFPQVDRRSCNHDNCLRAMIRHSDESTPFCAAYAANPTVTVPADFADKCDSNPIRLSSACACVFTAAPSSTTSKPSVTTTITTPVSTTSTSTTTTTSSSSTISSSSVVISSTSTTISVSCTATVYAQIAPAVAACTSITLQDIYAPSNSSIDLSKLKTGAVVTFAGTTTFGFTNVSTFDPIIIAGKTVTIQGAPGHLIDGNGGIYWDGLGSNGGVPKPNHFLAISKMTAGSVIKDLNIKNWPVHCFSISNCADLTITNIFLNNTDGEAPNARSGTLAAAHNSDGFDLSNCNRTSVTNSIVLNQDDCVAVTSGYNVTVDNMYCYGGHGLSIGSVGGKSINTVVNITFSNSIIAASENGARIKTNYNTTGFISGITYENILLDGITRYGLDVQQDYLNGGPTGSPSNGVVIQDLLFKNLTGTVLPTGRDYYILCGDGSCSNFVFDGVAIVGGGVASSCNFPTSTCPGP